jgi:hypothetical protein
MEDPAELSVALSARIQKHLLADLKLTLNQVYETEGEVCQLNSPELRPEFRLTFTQNDVLDYLYAMQHRPELKSAETLPADTGMFWDRVQLGRELRSESQ